MFHEAITFNNIPCAKLFLELGIDPNIRTNCENTPLYLIRSVKTGKILLDNNALIPNNDNTIYMFEAGKLMSPPYTNTAEVDFVGDCVIMGYEVSSKSIEGYNLALYTAQNTSLLSLITLKEWNTSYRYIESPKSNMQPPRYTECQHDIKKNI